MKILFIGGTGRLSKDVALRAVDDGNDVYLITRGSKDRKIFVDTRYKMLYLDITNYEVAREKLSSYKFDVVIDFLSYNTEQLKRTMSILGSNYKQYVFISTATVYSPKEKEIISEDKTTVGNRNWSYSYEKYLCEKYLEETFKSKYNQYFTIIRPYVTYGNTRVPYPIVPQSADLEWTLVNRINLGLAVPLFDNGKTVTTLTHTKDFAVSVNKLFGNELAFNDAFHVVSKERICWGDVLECIGNALNCTVQTVNFSQKEIYASMKEYKGILLGDKGREMLFDTSKLERAIGQHDSGVSLQEGVSDMINFYTSNAYYQKIDYMWNGRVDRLCKLKFFATIKKYKFSTIKEVLEYISGRCWLFFVVHKVYKKIKG